MTMKVNKKQKWLVGLISGGLVCVVALSVAIAKLPEQKKAETPQSTEQVLPKKKEKTSDSSLSKKEKEKIDSIIKGDKNELGSRTSELLGDRYSRSVSSIRETPTDKVIATALSSEKKETAVRVNTPVTPQNNSSNEQESKPLPLPDLKPTPDPEPIPTPTPDPEPTPTPDYSELVHQVTANADTVKGQANAINQALKAVKKEMENLNTIGDTTSDGLSEVKSEAEKMQELIDKYTALSNQIKAFITENGEVDALHVDEYKALYGQLKTVVTDISATNQSMKATQQKMQESLAKAKETAAEIDAVKEQVTEQKAEQAAIQELADQTNQTVVENPAIAEEVTQPIEDMNTQLATTTATVNAVDQELAIYESQAEEMQETLDTAEMAVNEATMVVSEATAQAEGVINEFAALPDVPQQQNESDGGQGNETIESVV